MVTVGDRGRKLRARGVSATSATPLTRSAVAAAFLGFSNNRTASQYAEAPRHSTATTSKGAPKRAAATDNSSCSSSTTHVQQAKKCPSLANSINRPSTSNAVPPPQKFVATFYRRFTRGDERRFREACAQEAVRNRSLPRVLDLFSSECRNLWIHIPGASVHTNVLMKRIYHGVSYYVRLHQSLKDLSVCFLFGQIPHTIIETETLEEACRRVGIVLNESIQSFIEVDHLYALPDRHLELYDTTSWSGYRIYEASVRVDLESPTQLRMDDLEEIIE